MSWSNDDDSDSDWDIDGPEPEGTDDWLEACPQCGAMVYEDSPQCPVCGEYIIQRRGPMANKPLWLVILLIGLVLWLIVSMILI